MTYAEKLKDPRWQKRRLEVLQASDFACDDCGETTKTLHVHHRRYRKGREPWEYDDDDLQCLCEECHEKVTELDQQISKFLGTASLSSKYQIIGYSRGLSLYENPHPCVNVENFEVAEGLGAAFGVDAEDVLMAVGDGQNHISFAVLRMLATSRSHGLRWRSFEARFQVKRIDDLPMTEDDLNIARRLLKQAGLRQPPPLGDEPKIEAL